MLQNLILMPLMNKFIGPEAVSFTSQIPQKSFKNNGLEAISGCQH